MNISNLSDSIGPLDGELFQNIFIIVQKMVARSLSRVLVGSGGKDGFSLNENSKLIFALVFLSQN